MTLKTSLPIAAVATAILLAASPGEAQSSASSYSYGTYNPVQAAINRNSMNDAIIKQATGKNARHATRRSTVKRRR